MNTTQATWHNDTNRDEAMTETTGTTETPAKRLEQAIAAAFKQAEDWDAGLTATSSFSSLAAIAAKAVTEAGWRPPAAPGAGEAEPYFANISFMGRIEYWGVRVTEITKHGQAAYRIEEPEHVFSGDPYAVHFHAAQAWFSEDRVTEAEARRTWEKRLRDAEDRRRREDEWHRAQEQRALEAASSATADGYSDEDEF